MINFDLHCNISECRALLQHQAVVTKCTHIFCVSCAAAVNLTAGRRTDTFNHPACPACEATLSGPDDAVMTVLNPTDAYKDSVLSGLSPDLIMEIAQKGLKFWAYQASMEL